MLPYRYGATRARRRPSGGSTGFASAGHRRRLASGSSSAVGRRGSASLARSCASPRSSPPAISSPILGREVSVGTTSPTILPRYMTRDAVGQRRASRPARSRRCTTGRAASRSSTIRRCMNSIAPTSRPRVGCETTSSCSGRDSSRASTTFCWLPPDSVPAGVAADVGADVELLDPRLAVARDRVQVRGRGPAVELRRVVQVEDQVLGDGEVADQPVVQPVLRHVADAECRARRRGRAPVARLPSSTRRARAPGAGPTSASASSVCPLPCTPAMPRSPRRAPERDVVDEHLPAVVDDRHALDLQHRLAGLGRVPCRRPAARRGRPSARPARVADAVGIGRARRPCRAG